tara:strand:- start:1071 stop:2897 length:1827 start_codon:yes stop_codon:yes gene_type:complete
MTACSDSIFNSAISLSVLRPLSNLSDHFDHATDKGGYLECVAHGVDHTGKSSRSILIDCGLFQSTNDEIYFNRAKSRVNTILSRLAPDPEHGGWIFHPGRLDARNMSTSAIDGGEVTDALTTFLVNFEQLIDDKLQGRILDAIVQHVDSYLAQAAINKEVTNQRLWAAMGVASAYVVTENDEWKQKVLQSVEISFAEQNDDGSFPYHPRPNEFDLHDGARGATVYYHSRHLAFADHILRCCGELEAFDEQFGRGIEFLRSLITPEGFKPLILDSKPWFWNGDFETGSHPYDIYALAAHGDQADRRIISSLLARMMDSQCSDGSFAGVLKGSSGFVCRQFHNADVAWLVRASKFDQLMPEYSPVSTSNPIRTRIFVNAGIARVQSSSASAIVAAPPGPKHGILYGSRAAGASLVHLSRRAYGWKEEVSREEARSTKLGWSAPCRFSLETITRYLSDNPIYRDIRFRIYVARTIAGYGRPIEALRNLTSEFSWILGQIIRPRISSGNFVHWDLQSEGVCCVVFRGGLADLSGHRSNVVQITRSFSLTEDGQLIVQEVAQINAPIDSLRFQAPSNAMCLTCSDLAQWAVNSHKIEFKNPSVGTSIKITYEL